MASPGTVVSTTTISSSTTSTLETMTTGSPTDGDEESSNNLSQLSNIIKVCLPPISPLQKAVVSRVVESSRKASSVKRTDFAFCDSDEEDDNAVTLKFVTSLLTPSNAKSKKVVIFTKSTCPFCTEVRGIFDELQQKYTLVELDTYDSYPIEGGGVCADKVQDCLKTLSGIRTVPQVFFGGKFIGDCSRIRKLQANRGIFRVLEISGSTIMAMADLAMSARLSFKTPVAYYDYDVLVIGGGSGGLACVKEIAALTASRGDDFRVAVCDYVRPSPPGTTWGLGGTCVNVGCIPKKLMHRAAILGGCLEDAESFGWNFVRQMTESQDSSKQIIATHNWKLLVKNIHSHIRRLNLMYRRTLQQSYIDYFNAYATFIDGHKIALKHKKPNALSAQQISAGKIVLAMGLRPKYPDIPGAREYGITSDDLFTLKYPPGKTLCIGGSYVSLECAGFLKGIGFDVDVMVRSIFLRGFDQDMAERIGAHMADVVGIKFHRPYVPTKIEQLGAPDNASTPGRLLVTMQNTDTKATMTQEYNTVLFAIGREPIWKDMNFEGAGIETNPKTGKILVDNQERTSNPNIFALGDAIDNWELTPVAIQAGNLLARRLFGKSTKLMDYTNVPTTVFTPLEYGSIGMAEEDAEKKFGKDDIEVYHSAMSPLEWTLPARPDTDKCYLKLICVKSQKERVVGLHVLGPDAGEMTQGFGVAFKCGATFQHFQDTVGIHPTNAELFTTVKITKSSGQGLAQGGC